MRLLQFKRAAPYLAKFSVAGAVASVAGILANGPHTTAIFGQDISDIAQQSGAPELLQLAGGMVGGKLGEYLKDALRQRSYGFNGDLQKAFEDALQLAVHALRKKYEQEYLTKDQEKATRFFDALLLGATLPADLDETTIHKLADAYVQDKGSFLLLLQELTQLEIAEENLDDNLLRFSVEQFPAQMEHAFLTQLKEPEQEKARISYTIYLSEESLRLAKGNEAGLQEVHRLLELLMQQQQLNREQNENVRQLLRKLEDELRQQRHRDNQTRESLLRLEEQNTIKLHLPRVAYEEKLLFIYKAGYTDFLGREAEIQQLDEFVRNDGNRFAWLLMTGPGGVGKSRLALHYCKKLRGEGFEAGFLSAESLQSVDKIRFQGPTLIVIDYVAAYASQIVTAIEKLHRRDEELVAPVRLLLLERDAHEGEGWWQQFEKDEVWTCRFRLPGTDKPVMPLLGLEKDDHWQLISAVYKKRKSEDIPYERDAVLRELYRIDPQQRPLFALFVSVALADGLFVNLQTWGVRELLATILQREREVWVEHGAEKQEPKQHENLLVLNTLAQGMSQTAVIHVCRQATTTEEWLPKRPNRDLYNHIARIRPAMAEDASVLAEEGEAQQTNYYGDKPEIWLGVQPDILGEYYLLTRIEEWIRNTGSADEMVALVQTAWEMHPAATRDFIEKTLFDYKELQGIGAYRLLLDAKPKLSARLEAWSNWGWMQVSGTTRPLSNEGPAASRQYYYQKLHKEVAAQTEKSYIKLLAFRQAQAAANLVIHYGETGQLETATQYYIDLQELVQTWPSEQGIAERLAKAINNMIVYYGENNQMEAAERCYYELEALSLIFLKNSEIAQLLASASHNFINLYLKINNLEMILFYYNKLQKLVEERDGELAVAEHLIKSNNNLVIYYGEAGDLKAAEQYFKSIKVLLKKYPNSLIAKSRLAKVFNNLIIYYFQAGKEQLAKECYNELLSLWQSCLDSLEITEEFTKAIGNLVIFYVRVNKIDMAEHYYAQLLIMARHWHNVLDIAKYIVAGGSCLIVYYSEDKQLDMVAYRYNELMVEVQTWPDGIYLDINVAEWLAEALYHSVVAHSKIGTQIQIEQYYVELQALSKIWTKAPTVIRWRVMAAYDLVTDYIGNKQLQMAQQYYTELQLMGQVWPNDIEVAEWIAKGTYNLITVNILINLLETAEQYYRELQKIKMAWPSNLIIATASAAADYNLVNIYSKNKDWEQAEKYYVELQMVAFTWPSVLEIAEWLTKAISVLITDYIENERWSIAEQHYTELQVLIMAWSDTLLLAKELANVIHNLVCGHIEHNQIENAEIYYTDLQKLVHSWSNTLVLTKSLNGTNCTLINYYCRRGLWDRVEQCYKELWMQVQNLPTEIILAKDLALVTGNIIVNYGNAGKWSEAEHHYATLQSLGQIWCKELIIAERVAEIANFLAKLFYRYVYKISVLDRSWYYYQHWLALHEQFPNDIK